MPMTTQFRAVTRSARARRAWAVAFVGLLTAFAGLSTAHAQFVQRSVGGVFIKPRGMVANLQPAEQDQLRQEREKALKPAEGELKTKTALRKISLRRLEEA